MTPVLFATFGISLLLGNPVAVALGVAALVTLVSQDIDLVYLVQVAYTSIDSFPLMAVPSFVLAGILMEKAGVSRRLVEFAEALAGPVTGGLAITVVVACVFFGAITGSGPAATAAVGALLIPAMIARNYDRGFSAAITSASGGLGIIIPPSIPMVIYGVSANQSITKLFIAGVIPGLIVASALIVTCYFYCKKLGYKGTQETWSSRLILRKFKDGFFAIFAPILILGGIYTGRFTPTESAIVAVYYTLFVGFFIYRELTFHKIREALSATTAITGVTLIIMFTARAFSRLLVQYQIPSIIADAIVNLTSSLTVLWILILLFLIIVGMFMEALAAIMLITPVFLPVMVKFGVDPIHFGVVLVLACAVGFVTPPVGENLFIACRVSGASFESTAIKTLPFVAALIAAMVLIAFFPQLSLWLPGLME